MAKYKKQNRNSLKQAQGGEPIVASAKVPGSPVTAPSPMATPEVPAGSSATDSTAMPLDLLRARAALQAIDSLKDTGYGNYVSYVEGLPATILQNGLGQALATLLAGAKLTEPANKRSDDERAHETLYRQTQAWLCRPGGDAPYPDQIDLMHAITQADEDAYLRAQAEALAYLRWLKKFAVAFLKEQEAP
jgi:CRISPR-associated protein Cmr5